ncbi:MAG: hypothetical protein FWF28_06220 [Micrococcales bacterium]|nr:hypothetical protein [Micrococcales bacterium]
MDSIQYSAAVAQNVSEAIRAARRSVLSVATEAGIARGTLERRLKSGGLSSFSVSEIKSIANVLGCTAASLTMVTLAAEVA